jgi:hypothetical protein
MTGRTTVRRRRVVRRTMRKRAVKSTEDEEDRRTVRKRTVRMRRTVRRRTVQTLGQGSEENSEDEVHHYEKRFAARTWASTLFTFSLA